MTTAAKKTIMQRISCSIFALVIATGDLTFALLWVKDEVRS
jgi:hypothetical protein